eukprot:m.230947 g.230947  ORF g.230947 m.230947 type:complete len:70 (-) comp17062_c0_seq6:231-440(-)
MIMTEREGLTHLGWQGWALSRKQYSRCFQLQGTQYAAHGDVAVFVVAQLHVGRSQTADRVLVGRLFYLG